MKYLLLLAALGLTYCPHNANAQFKPYGETDMKWPGIHCQIFWLQRLPSDRLVVGVRLLATQQAPPGGTLIGYPVPIPPGLTAEQKAAGDFVPRPYSLASSIMIDNATNQQYPTLPPVSSPGGQSFYPGQGLATLTPGQLVDFTIQFKVPPPPPPPEPGQPPVKQTLSFLFTNAKEPIKGIAIPPPVPTAK